jgi:hypothetical protein
MQSPQPRPVQTKGFAAGGAMPAVSGKKKPNAIFEPFEHKRSVTPELDAVLKKGSVATWGQWELEQDIKSD